MIRILVMFIKPLAVAVLSHPLTPYTGMRVHLRVLTLSQMSTMTLIFSPSLIFSAIKEWTMVNLCTYRTFFRTVLFTF